MIQNELYRILLAGMLLVATPQLIVAGSYRIETLPPERGVCLYCKTTEACQSYAAGSICNRGQCTNENGLFGVGCGCNAASECASGRCEGMFERTCQDKLKNGEVCFGGVDCISGRCNSMLFCEPSYGGNLPPHQMAGEIGDPERIPPGAHGSSMMHQQIDTASTNNINPITTAGHHHKHDVGALLAGDREPEFRACTACANDSECGGGGGSCLDGFCADSSGEHPPTCITCRGDDDCIGGYYCYSNMNLNRSGKKCAVKRVNGASCSRNEACKSGHCNVLFRCESNLPSHKRPSTDPTSTSHEEQDRSFSGGILIWTSVIVAFMMLGVFAGLFWQRDKCCPKQLDRRGRFDSEESHTCDIEFHDEHDHDHNHDEHHHTTTTSENYDYMERPQIS